MSRYPARRKSAHRYVRLLLEELEWRYVPSLLGLQINLPSVAGGLPPLPVSLGGSTIPTAAQTTPSTPTPTSGTTTSSSPLGPVPLSFTPTTTSNPSSAPPAGTSAGVSQAPASASSGSGTGTWSSGSPSAFSGGMGQGSSSAFTVPGSAPAASAPGLGIQAALSGSSSTVGGTVLGGAVTNADFELLGNLPWLLGPANVQAGMANTALSNSSLMGAPLAGPLFYRPDLFTDRTTGESTARGLSHPAPGDREEPLPEQMLIPPDEDWFQPAPQNIEQTLPVGNILLRNQANFPAGLLRLAPQNPDEVNAQVLDAPPADLRADFIFSEEDLGIPTDEEETEEEQSVMSPALALLSCGAGAYWTIRDRRVRRSATDLPVNDEEM